MIPRRIFLRNGAAAVVGLSAVPGFLVRTLEAAQPATARGKKLVVLFPCLLKLMRELALLRFKRISTHLCETLVVF